MIKDFDLLQRANNDYTTIDLEHAEELAYRELIDSIRYIPLGDECGVMGNIANIITYKGRFYIQEEQFDRVFIYDDTGRCLKKIDNKGRGPGIFPCNILSNPKAAPSRTKSPSIVKTEEESLRFSIFW